MGKYVVFTSESVTEGHPDLVADRISDHLVDCFIAGDPDSRVAVEVQCSTNLVVLAGEVTSKAVVSVEEEVRKVIKSIGYTRPEDGFSYDSVRVLQNIVKQSPDIAMGVDAATDVDEKDTGAGDIGIMFGFATRVHGQDNYMPIAFNLATALVREMDRARHAGENDCMRPDGKAQVTVAFDSATGKPVKVLTVVVCCSHSEDCDLPSFKSWIVEHIVEKVIPSELMDSDTKVFVNPTGRFAKHGPAADCGTTGRKIVVAQYGGSCAVGGGSLSTKDPTKVDRTGAYAARYIAQNLVRHGYCDECEVEVAYSIGQAKPISIAVKAPGKSKEEEAELAEVVASKVDLRPSALIQKFDMRRPIYENLSVYGHFGRTLEEAPWEADWDE